MTDRAEHGARVSHDEMAEMRSRLEALASIVSDLDEDLERAKRERDELRAENQVLRDDLTQLEEDTKYIREIGESKEDIRKRRMAVILQTLRNKTIQNGGSARMDASDCETALRGEAHRTTMYDLMPSIARSVESDAVKYVKESKNSRRNSRLVMDQSEGQIPTTFEGYDLTGTEVA